MSTNAREYAESVGRGFWKAHDDGHVFGLQECPECSTAAAESCEHDEDREPVDAYDFLTDVLDISYVVSGSGDYKGAEILLSFGGPNAWIDTRTSSLDVAWDDSATWALPGDMIKALDEALDQMWTDAR